MRSGATLITEAVQRLESDFGLTPVTACEIEFYLKDGEALPDTAHLCATNNIDFLKSEKEKGRNQYEVALLPADPIKTARDVEILRSILPADFRARPFPDQPGSGLHIHIHLADSSGKNVFYKDDSTISDALKFSIGGLLATVRDHMKVFAPSPESYARFQPGSNAPMTISWGGNNRTVAIRLPDSAHDNKRIEHRVAGADADPAAVIAAVLSGIHYGLKNKSDPGQQIYGDAALEMYKLQKLA